MPVHHRIRYSRRLYYSFLSNLRSRYIAHLRRYREFYINLYNYLTYNDVD